MVLLPLELKTAPVSLRLSCRARGTGTVFNMKLLREHYDGLEATFMFQP
jgi:hypothetical protein